MVMSPNAQLRPSARNQLEGKVARLHPGAVNTEVVIELPGGAVITAIVTNESASTWVWTLVSQLPPSSKHPASFLARSGLNPLVTKARTHDPFP